MNNIEKITIRHCILRLKHGDITKEKVDAIVNAANSLLMGGGGVDGAIHRIGGPIISEECKKIREMTGGCPVGEAVITSGGNLPSKYVIHTVGPIWQGGKKDEENLLRNAYRNSLTLAIKNAISTIAFPSISTGVYNFPIKKASFIALDEIVKFLKKKGNLFKEIRMILFSEKDFEIYKESLKLVIKNNKIKV